MTERNLSELTEAEIVPNQGGDNAWLVRFGPNDYDTVNRSSKNRLLLKEADFPIQDTISYNGLTVDYDLGADDISLEQDGKEVDVPAAKQENVLWGVYENDEQRLKRLHDELYTPTVREGLIDMLIPRFRTSEHEIEKTDDGYLIDDSILVKWDATNTVVSVDETHVVSGGETVRADTEKEAREIKFDVSDNTAVALPNGTSTLLDDVEIKFLTTIALIVGHNPSDMYNDGLSETIQDSYVDGFTDSKSGLHHAHDTTKHTLDMLGVTQEAIDRLWYNSYDHAGVWELALRRDEFINAPIDVFEDASNASPSKWEKIESTKEKAPIPQHIRGDLEARYS